MDQNVTFTVTELVTAMGILGGIVGFLAGWLLTLLTSRNTSVKLNDHLVECTRRYNEWRLDIAELRKGIEGLYTRKQGFFSR